MQRVFLGATALAVVMTAPATAQQRAAKIGFVSTFSGPTAVIGNDPSGSSESPKAPAGRRPACYWLIQGTGL